MAPKASTPEQYISELPAGRKEAVTQLRNTIASNIPGGFKEVMAHGMIGWVVPHELFPPGYHCNPQLPLLFVSIASQKNFISLHHMGLYGSNELSKWFVAEYAKQSPSKLDMGKACVRFKKPEHIPHKLIGELMKKISADDWIRIYQKALQQRKS